MNPTRFKALLPIDAAGLGVAAAIAGLIYFAWIGPALRESRESRVAAAELSARLDEVTRLKGELAQAEARAREARQRVEQAPRILHPLSAMNARLSELTNLAVECSLVVESLAPGEPARQERLIRVPLRVSGRGGYADCVRFLEHVHEQFPDVDVEGIRLVSVREDGADASFALDCAWLAAHEVAPVAKPASGG